MPKTRPQPALAVLRMRRLTNRQVARDLGYSAHWVGRVLNGHDDPAPPFRRALADYLGLPEIVLFHAGPTERAAS
jgi:transcriptional regulator with XRE-family HTH domain